MNKKKFIRSLFIRVLLSILLFLVVGILINRSDKFLLFYKNNVYDKNLKFSKLSTAINKIFGKTLIVDENVTAVNKEIKSYLLLILFVWYKTILYKTDLMSRCLQNFRKLFIINIFTNIFSAF